MLRWLSACAPSLLLGACCSLGPAAPVPIDAPRIDADLDASVSGDVGLDARAPTPDGWASTIDDVWVERTDGCVLPIAADRVGLPCESVSDCPPAYACLAPSRVPMDSCSAVIDARRPHCS